MHLRGDPGRELVEYPAIGLPQAFGQRDTGLPTQRLPQEGVVAVSAADTLGGTQVVVALHLDPGDLLDLVDQAVDRHQLAGAQIYRLPQVGPHQGLSAIEAVADVGEAPGLLAVAPDLDLVLPLELRLRDLAADRGRGLLAPPLESAVRPVDVVVADNARFEPEVLGEVPAHALREELLPAVAVFRHRRVS